MAVWDQLPYAGLVDAAVFSVEVGARKPDPAMYDEVARALSVDPAWILYVGDGGSSKLTGARRAGMRPVLLRESTDEPATTRDDIPELRRLLTSCGVLAPHEQAID